MEGLDRLPQAPSAFECWLSRLDHPLHKLPFSSADLHGSLVIFSPSPRTASSSTQSFTLRGFKPRFLLSTEFLQDLRSSSAGSGLFLCSAASGTSFQHNALALSTARSPQLRMLVDKETYQSLGIQGRRLENAFLPKKKPFVFVVDVDVMHESFRPGKALYERVLWCLGDDRVAPVDVNLVLDLEKEKDFRAIMRDSWKWTDCSIEERIHQMESTDHHALMDKLEIRWDDLLDEIRNSDNEKRKCIMEDLLNWIGMLAISRGKDRKSQKDIQSVWDSGLFSTESLSKHMQENATMSLSSQSLKGPLLSAQIQSVISSLQEQLQQVDSQGNPNDWAVLVGEFEKDLHHTDYFGQERRGWALILLPDSRYISIKYPSDSLQQSKLN